MLRSDHGNAILGFVELVLRLLASGTELEVSDLVEKIFLRRGGFVVLLGNDIDRLYDIRLAQIAGLTGLQASGFVHLLQLLVEIVLGIGAVYAFAQQL